MAGHSTIARGRSIHFTISLCKRCHIGIWHVLHRLILFKNIQICQRILVFQQIYKIWYMSNISPIFLIQTICWNVLCVLDGCHNYRTKARTGIWFQRWHGQQIHSWGTFYTTHVFYREHGLDSVSVATNHIFLKNKVSTYRHLNLSLMWHHDSLWLV